MDGIKIEVAGNVARVTERPSKITAGTVGLPVEFTFDEQWEGLNKTAVFRAGNLFKIAERLETETVVPWETLKIPGLWLSIGVYGVNEDGTEAIPTIWANVSVIHVGAQPEGDPSTDPTLPVYQKLLDDVGDPADLNTENKKNLVSAVNEVLNIAAAGGIETDPTLSQSGKAAEAKVTGEGIAKAQNTANAAQSTANTALTAANNAQSSANNAQGTANQAVAEAAKANTAADNAQSTAAAALPKAGGTMAGNIAMGGNKITGLGTPTADTDAATKAYSDKINVSFGALTGSLSDINKTSLYWYSTSNSGRPSNGASTYGLVETLVTTNGGRVQNLYGGNGELARRIYAGNAWSEWEWVIPPLVAGVEYRTAERWKNKTVYAKQISTTFTKQIGNASGFGQAEIEHNIGTTPTVVRVEANFNGQHPIPYVDSAGGIITVANINSEDIVLHFYKTYWDNPTVNVTLHYTKG